MKAMDVMVRDVVTVRPDDSVADAAKLLISHDISALPVVDADGKLIGELSSLEIFHKGRELFDE